MTEAAKAPNRLSMEIDPSAITAIVRETVNASIAAALQKQGVDFAGAVVQAILEAKVDNDGKIIPRGHYNYSDTRYPNWFDHHLNQMLRDCAKTAMSEFVAGQQPQIQKAMLAAFKKRTPDIIKTMTDGTMEAFSRKWGFTFNVNIDRKDTP